MVSDVISDASVILNDTEHVTYTLDQLLQGINRSCLATVLVKPEACSDLFNVPLIMGVLQKLPEKALRLLDAYYRLDETGNPVAHITMAERKEFDFLPGPSGPVQHVAYDEKIPQRFTVDPPAAGGEHLMLVCSQIPPQVVKESDPFPLPEKYQEPVLEYLLYLMFSRDAERSPNAQRALSHRQAFFDLLQVKTQADMTVSAEAKRLAGA